MTDISMLVTLNVAAFVVIMLVSLFAVTTLVRGAILAADGADVVALPPWLPIPFPHPATPNTRKHTTMTNALLVLLLLHIETPLSHCKTRGWRLLHSYMGRKPRVSPFCAIPVRGAIVSRDG